MIYLHNQDDIFVNLFLPSVLTWEEKGIRMIQDTYFPYEESVSLTFEMDKPLKFSLNIRIPSWIKGDLAITVNDREQNIQNLSDIYASVTRRWKSGDVVTISFEMGTRIEYLPDGSHWASILHGPVVLAAVTGYDDLDGLFADDSRMGHVAGGPNYPIDNVPMIMAPDKDFSSLISPLEDQPMAFTLSGIYPGNTEITLVPFYEIHEARYTIYWPVYTPEELKE
jgi:uncharacterized protein